jgi:hypothetical protein
MKVKVNLSRYRHAGYKGGGMGTHCTRGWEGLKAGMDTEVRGKIL